MTSTEASLDVTELLGDFAPPLSLNTKSGWRAFSRQQAEPPPAMLSTAQRARITAAERHVYDLRRISYHLDEPFIRHEALNNAIAFCVRRIAMNTRSKPNARRGVLILGPGGTGKTQALWEIAKQTDRHVISGMTRRRELNDLLPSVLISTPDRPQLRRPVVDTILEFLEHPLPKKVRSTDEVIPRLAELVIALRTVAYLFDDLGFLRTQDPKSSAPNDFMKRLMNAIPVTLIGTAINNPRFSMLSEGGSKADDAFSQTGRRFSVVYLPPFKLVPLDARQRWTNLLATYEAWLRLTDARPRDLIKLDEYLHQRTQGRLISLTSLLCQGAVEAIEGGAERITQPLLDEIKIDAAAQGVTRSSSDR